MSDVIIPHTRIFSCWQQNHSCKNILECLLVFYVSKWKHLILKYSWERKLIFKFGKGRPCRYYQHLKKIAGLEISEVFRNQFLFWCIWFMGNCRKLLFSSINFDHGNFFLQRRLKDRVGIYNNNISSKQSLCLLTPRIAAIQYMEIDILWYGIVKQLSELHSSVGHTLFC